jgi:hypothetical protein
MAQCDQGYKRGLYLLWTERVLQFQLNDGGGAGEEGCGNVPLK